MMLSPQVKSSLLTALFTVILFFIMNALFAYYNIPFTALSSSSNKTIFTSQGTGTATAKPDKAQISFTVNKTATKQQDAQNLANTATNTIVSDVEKLGITKNNIQTSNYNSYPNYAPVFRPEITTQTILSYTVSENVTISITDDAKVNTVIDTITKDGAESIAGPNYTFSDASQQSLQDKARLLAIKDAKQKAESIAQAAGVRLGKITNVQEDNTGGYPIHPIMDSKAAISNGSVPTQINPGQNTVTVNVTLSYETY